MTKFEKLCEVEGVDQDGYLSQWGHDSVVPGICANDGCDYTCDVEPDSDGGWCEVCDTNTVKSGLILLGII